MNERTERAPVPHEEGAAGTCFHCGLLLPVEDSRRAELGGRIAEFCCAGCEAAARLIYASGLGSYYRFRDKSAQLPSYVPEPADAATLPDYAHLDDPALARSFVADLEDGEQEASLIITGIRCAACVWLLERYLGEQEGVSRVAVSLATQRAFVRFERARITPSRLFGWIHRLGYEAHPYRPGEAERLHARERSRRIKELGLAGIVLMQVMMFSIALYSAGEDGMISSYRSLFEWASLVLVTPLIFYSAASFFRTAWADVRAGVAGMDLPVSIALAAAYGLSAWNTIRASGETYYDSISMFTFFLLLGRFLEFQARHHSSRTANELTSIFPPSAVRISASDPSDALPERSVVAVEQLRPGDRVAVAEGTLVPVDGALRGEAAMFDRSMLSGESEPVRVARGGAVLAGTINLQGEIVIEVTSAVEHSVVSGLIRLSERAAAEKPAIATLADRVAAGFVVVVLLVAAGAGIWWYLHQPERAMPVLLSILVISCPCALSLAIPAAFTVATYRLAEIGFLVVHGHVLERFAHVAEMVFDKTGTLTVGHPMLTRVDVVGALSEEECRKIAGALEQGLSHPVARALAAPSNRIVEAQSHVVGQGVEGRIDGRRYRLGRPAFVVSGSIDASDAAAGRQLLLGDDTGPLAWFHLTDALRPDSIAGVAALRELGVDIGMITGDNEAAAAQIARQLGIHEMRAELSPEEKMDYIGERLKVQPELVMVGDGVNDLAALSLATTSVVVKDASDFVQASSDAIILSNRISDLARAVRMARRTRRIIRQNVAWAVLYNVAALPIAVAGWVEPWIAALGMSASSLAVVGNALRLSRRAP